MTTSDIQEQSSGYLPPQQAIPLNTLFPPQLKIRSWLVRLCWPFRYKTHDRRWWHYAEWIERERRRGSSFTILNEIFTEYRGKHPSFVHSESPPLPKKAPTPSFTKEPAEPLPEQDTDFS